MISTIDSSGNITLNRASNFAVPFAYQAMNGTPITLDPSNLVFAIKGLPPIVPENDPQDANGVIFRVTPENAVSLGSKPKDYEIILTTTSGPTCLLAATIVASGFAL